MEPVGARAQLTLKLAHPTFEGGEGDIEGEG